MKTDHAPPPKPGRQSDFACPVWTLEAEEAAQRASAWPWQQPRGQVAVTVANGTGVRS